MKMKSGCPKLHAGFTLIELLVAMTTLLVIVMICAQIFQQARMAWASGQDMVDMNMTGRAVVDCIAQELASAVDVNINIEADSIQFTKLGKAEAGTPALTQVIYGMDANYVLRNGVRICPSASCAAPRPGILSLVFSPVTNILPDRVDITANVAGPSATNLYQTRVYFHNRQRYEL